MYVNNPFENIAFFLRRRPQAWADIIGGASHPNLRGSVRFWNTESGVFVAAAISGLPSGEQCAAQFFGFHIHEGGSCTGNAEDPFASAGTHYNPNSCPHPAHAGDLPPLLGANGIARSVFLTDRFELPEIIGKTVIIHSSPDDFTSQPSGNSGSKIACGVIRIG